MEDEININMDKIKISNKFTKIASKLYHSVAICENGTLFMFGNDSYDQRDNFPLDGEYIDVVCGFFSTVALRKDGSIISWGNKCTDEIVKLLVFTIKSHLLHVDLRIQLFYVKMDLY